MTAPVEYRQRPASSDVWHFRPDCQHWPELRDAAGKAVSGITVRVDKPTTGELCNECQAKARRAEAGQ